MIVSNCPKQVCAGSKTKDDVKPATKMFRSKSSYFMAASLPSFFLDMGGNNYGNYDYGNYPNYPNYGGGNFRNNGGINARNFPNNFPNGGGNFPNYG
jgi:hypothetical protein